MIEENIKTFTPLHWLGNMSPCAIFYEGEKWNSAESLFQAMRFNDDTIRQQIRSEKGIFKPKKIVQQYAEQFVVQPMSTLDIENLRTVMELKFSQNKVLQLKLISTGNLNLIQFTSNHSTTEDLFWGMTIENEQWIGKNIVGKMLVEIREKLKYFNN